MKIIVLGANGQLGQQLCRVLPGELVALAREQADLTKPVELRRAIEQMRPRHVVNAAAYTHVDRAESEPGAAFAANALALRDLAVICSDMGSTLIHYSTNYVFGLDETRTTPYTEADAPGPISVYGNSKLAGEYFVRSLCPKHFILRTCGLYGSAASEGKRGNIVQTLLRKGMEKTLVRVVDDQICTPTSIVDLAEATRQLVDSSRFGLYHVTNAGSCSWHEFARTLFALKGCPAPLAPISSQEYGVPAKRPRYSVLSNARWADAGFTPLRSWQEALERIIQ